VKLAATLLATFVLFLTAKAQDTPRGSVPAPPKGPTPKTVDGHPDLTGFWRDDGNAHPHGNIGKDLPGFKLPFTAAGEAAHKFNVEHVVDPESRCLPGSIPREDAGDGGFQLLQVHGTTVFLYQYGTFRLIATDGAKHTEDPDPTYFGEEIGSWDGDTFVIDSVAFQLRCFGPDTRSNTLANVSGHGSTFSPTLTPTSQTAISNFVCSVKTASTRSKNFHTSPASTAPAIRTPPGEFINFVKMSSAEGKPKLLYNRLI
jgi:hypothetical protein